MRILWLGRGGGSQIVFLLMVWVAIAAVPCLADYAVSVSATPAKIVDSGHLVTHVFSIANAGTDDDIYLLDLALPIGWSPLPIPASLAVSAGDQGIVFVNFIVPLTAEAGDYEILLTASSSFGAGIEADAAASVVVRPTYGLYLEWIQELGSGQAGQTRIGSFIVTNRGNAPDRFEIKTYTNAEWLVEVTPQSMYLDSGQSQRVIVRLQIPETAAQGARLTLTLVASSNTKPDLTESLTSAIVLGPPPPALVGGSLFPEWSITGTFFIDCNGDPQFTFRGSGTIERLGEIDISFSLSMDGFSNTNLKLGTEDWTLDVGGGSISGSLLSISGKPYWSGQWGDGLKWQALFTHAVKGLSASYERESSSCRLAFGSDTARNLEFAEVEVDHDFLGPAAGWLTLETGTQTESGTAFGVGGELIFEGWDLAASYNSIGEGFPFNQPKEMWNVRASFEECPLPLDFTATGIERLAGVAPDEYTITGTNWAASIRIPTNASISITGSGSLGFQSSDDVPQTLDTVSRSVSGSIDGDFPISWSVSGGFQESKDRIVGTRTFTQQIRVDGSVFLGPISMDAGASFRAVTDSLGTIFSSGMSLSVRAEELFLSPTVSLSSANGGGSLAWGLSWDGPYGASFAWTGSLSLCAEPTFSNRMTLTLTDDFVFCGPTKGRISGYVFVDEDGDGVKDADEQGAFDVLLEAGEQQAVTGSGGWFVFPPMKPGAYDLEITRYPAGLTASAQLPLRVALGEGDEPVLWIPLEPRSWLMGRAFLDANQNGQRDGSERPIAGIRIQVHGQGLDRLVTTDANGRFVLEVPAGPLLASLDQSSLPERSEMTTPASASVDMPKYGSIDIVFGVYQRPRPVVITFGPPTAMFDVSSTAPRVGEEVRFTDKSQAVENSSIENRAWTFRLGDHLIEASGETIAVVFSLPGAWRVQLIVTDSDGLKGAIEKVIHVE